MVWLAWEEVEEDGGAVDVVRISLIIYPFLHLEQWLFIHCFYDDKIYQFCFWVLLTIYYQFWFLKIKNKTLQFILL